MDPLDQPYTLLHAAGVEPHADAVDELRAVLDADPTAGVVGARLVRADGLLQQAGGIVSTDGSVWSYGHGHAVDDPRFLHVREVDWVSTDFALVRNELLGLRSDELTGAQRDADFGLAVRKAGFTVVYQPFAEARLRSDSELDVAEADPRIELSVVIPTHNRAELLRASLESLVAQNVAHDRFEVVVVDDGSTDETGAVCEELAERLPLVYVAIPNSGIAAAKNAGVRAAHGAIVCFFDDDDVADPGMVAEHLRVHAERPEEHVAVLGYTTWGDWLDVTPLMRFVTDVGHYLFAYDGLEDGQELDYTYFWGGRSSCKRSFLLRHGLFNPTFTFGSEDIELGYRLSKHGLKVVFARNAVSLMNRAVTFEQFCRRVERQGRSQLWFSRLHAAPEVQKWCGVAGAAERWAQIEHELDGWSNRAELLEQTGGDAYHGLLWKVFDALKLKGIVSAAEETGELEPALRHETDRAALRAAWGEELLAQQAPEPALLRQAANRAPGKRIFVADLLLPNYTRASGARRMFEMLKLMRAQGHAVTFLAVDPSDPPRFVEELRRLGIETYPGDPEMSTLMGRNAQGSRIDLPELLSETDFDVVFLCLWYVAERYLEAVRRYAPRARVVLDTVDVHYLREQRHAELVEDALLAREAAETKLRELAVARGCDAVIAVTDVDADILRGELPGKPVYVVPNIHDVTEDAPGPEGRNGLLFVGNFLHKPNPDAVQWLHDEVMPLVWEQEPEATVSVVGFRPTAEVKALAGPRFEIVGEAPAMEPLLASHRVSVAPLRFGAGIKGKVCEALAAGIPVVTTSVGAEGMGIEPGRDVLLQADDARGYADAVVRVLRDDATWNALAEGGREYVEERLSSRTVGARLAEVVELESRRKADPELTSIVILVRDQPELTTACFESIAAHTPERHELVLVDNGSEEETAQLLAGWAAKHPHVRVVRNNANRGFAAGNNQGLALARGGVVVLLNNDTVVTDGWLGALRGALERHPEVGMVGPVTNNTSGPQRIDVDYGEEGPHAFAARWNAQHAGETAEIQRVVGFCMALRRELVDTIGGLDERYGMGNFEDDDFSVRAAFYGFRARIALDSFVHHVGNQTFVGSGIDHHEAMIRNWGLYKEKWGIPAATSVADDYEIRRELLAAASHTVPLPRIGLMHEPKGRVWQESDASRVLAAAAGAIQAGRVEGLQGAFAEAQNWVDPHRRYQTRKRLVEMVLTSPERGERDWMTLFAGALECLLDVLDEEPREPLLLNYAGVLLYELAQPKAAEALFAAALRLDPEHAEAKGNRAAAKQLLRSSAKGGPAGKLAAEVRGLAARAEALAKRARPADGLRVSLCMIVKDEEEMLPGCLASAKDAVDEMIVVDTGSSDRTVEIAESFGATVVHFPWNGSFADARNVSIDHATGDWIVYLDADEHLTPESPAALRALLGRTWREAFYFVETNFTGGEGSGEAVKHLALRLWRNRPEYRFEGRIHEQKTHAMPNYLPERFEKSDVTILHYGYLKTRIAAREKSQRNIELLEAQAEERGLDAFGAFNLGTEYVVAEQPEKALDYLEQSWSLLRRDARWPAEPYAPMLVARLGAMRRESGDLEGTRALVAEGLAVWPDFTDLEFKLALCAVDEKDWARAEEHALRCLELGDAPALYSGTVGTGTYLSLALLGQLREAQGDAAGAEEWYRRSLAEHPRFVQPVLPLATLLFRRGASPAEVEAIVPPGSASALMFAASACYEAGHTAEASDWFTRVLELDPANGAARVGLVEALLAEKRYDDLLAASAAQTDDTVRGRLALTELVVHAIQGNGDALAALLESTSLPDAERALFSAWLAGGTESLPADTLAPAATLLEVLLKLEEFDAFQSLYALYQAIDVPASTRSELLAAIYFRRGFLDSAADEWIASLQAEPAAGALVGLAHVAVAKGMPEDAVTFCDEALQLEPANEQATTLRDALLAQAA